jgi:hypothetical protein
LFFPGRKGVSAWYYHGDRYHEVGTRLDNLTLQLFPDSIKAHILLQPSTIPRRTGILSETDDPERSNEEFDPKKVKNEMDEDEQKNG